MAFPFQKIRRAVGGRRIPFPLLPVRVVRHAAMSVCHHVFVSAWWHVGIRNTDWIALPFPHGLVDGRKSVEVLNVVHNTLVYCLIRVQLVLNKRMMPNKRQRKEEVRAGLDAAVFPLHRPLGVVGILLSMYFAIYQHYIISIQQFNRISEALQQSFSHGVIPAHSLAWLIASLAAIHVGGIGKSVGCRGQLPALLHHFPYLRLLRLDLRTQQQGDDVVQAE